MSGIESYTPLTPSTARGSVITLGPYKAIAPHTASSFPLSHSLYLSLSLTLSLSYSLSLYSLSLSLSYLLFPSFTSLVHSSLSPRSRSAPMFFLSPLFPTSSPYLFLTFFTSSSDLFSYYHVSFPHLSSSSPFPSPLSFFSSLLLLSSIVSSSFFSFSFSVSSFNLFFSLLFSFFPLCYLLSSLDLTVDSAFKQ